jgi:hypothetical protein
MNESDVSSGELLRRYRAVKNDAAKVVDQATSGSPVRMYVTGGTVFDNQRQTFYINVQITPEGSTWPTKLESISLDRREVLNYERDQDIRSEIRNRIEKDCLEFIRKYRK